jgi:hypothetical protein
MAESGKQESDAAAASAGPGHKRDIHRIGGGSVANLRLTSQESAMKIPGFSVLKADTPEEAAFQMNDAFPGATQLVTKAKIVGSTSLQLIHGAGFDLMPDPTRKFPNHHRVIHRDGVAGFTDKNLSQLATAFYNSFRC